MNTDLIEQLNDLHEIDEHDKIIQIILELPQSELNYELKNLLGRAYNNISEYDKALGVFLSEEQQGVDDALWNFRVGYSYYYKDEEEKALPYFQKSASLGDTVAEDFVQYCIDSIEGNNNPSNNEIYEGLANEGLKLPSTMGIFAKASNFLYTKDFIQNQLNKSKFFKLISFERQDLSDKKEGSVLEQSYQISIEYQEEEFELNLYVISSNGFNLDEFGFGNTISETEMEQAKSQKHYLETTMYFNESALDSYHLQLKVMQSIVENPSLLIDFMPLRMLSGKWVEVTAQSEIPPAPSYLYVIHGVYGEDENAEKVYWLHTHGLHRCGSVELEVLNIRSGVEQMNSALNTIATRFINSENVYAENEIFSAGYDGLDITFCWQRWEDVINTFPANIPGGSDERTPERGGYEPCGVIMAVQEGHTISPEIYASTIADNPVFYISSEETERMSALAKDRFESFKRAFQNHFNPEADDENYWRFLVKLGFDVDHPMQTEHMWFDVFDINEKNSIFGVLLNQPYAVDNLNEGDEGWYPMDMLTDWVIYTPYDTLTSDNIYVLDLE